MNRKTLLKIAVPGAAGVAVAAAAVGVTAYATGIHTLPLAASSASPSPSPNAKHAKASEYCGDFMSHFAANLGTSTDKVNSAAQKAFQQTIDDAAAKGDISADQATKLKQRAASGNVCSGGLAGLNGGPRPGGPGAGLFGQAMDAYVNAAAKELGMQPADLKTDLKNGQTLHQLADQKGISEADFRKGLIANLQPQLDQAVKDGKLSQKQETEVLNRLQSGPLPLWDKPAPRGPRPGPSPSATP
jgi:polyhydroxyalkanoate synthesis regulator phasin